MFWSHAVKVPVGEGTDGVAYEGRTGLEEGGAGPGPELKYTDALLPPVHTCGIPPVQCMV